MVSGECLYRGKDFWEVFNSCLITVELSIIKLKIIECVFVGTLTHR